MSQWNSGSGGYLTRFEDYYKSSSDESDDGESKSKIQKIPPVPGSSCSTSMEDNKEAVFKQEAHYYSESDDEGEMTDPLGRVQEELPSKDWVPLSNDDLKLKIKPPKNFTGYKEGAYPYDIEEELEEGNTETEDKKFDETNDVDPSTVDEADITSDYSDLLKILCKICNKQIERDTFSYMHLKKHGMDVQDYKVSYGEPVPVKNSYHRCHLCQTIFVFTRSRLAGHLARHKISVKEYAKKFLQKNKYEGNITGNMAVGEVDTNCLFSNDYEDECQTICKICRRGLNYGNLGSHIYQAHSVRMKAGVNVLQSCGIFMNR